MPPSSPSPRVRAGIANTSERYFSASSLARNAEQPELVRWDFTPGRGWDGEAPPSHVTNSVHSAPTDAEVALAETKARTFATVLRSKGTCWLESPDSSRNDGIRLRSARISKACGRVALPDAIVASRGPQAHGRRRPLT